MGRPKAANRADLTSFRFPESWKLGDVSFRDAETRDEIKARIARETLAATHRVYRESASYLTLCLTVFSVALICIWIVLRQAYSPETQEWAATLLTTIVSGGVGYFTGKASGKGEA